MDGFQGPTSFSSIVLMALFKSTISCSSFCAISENSSSHVATVFRLFLELLLDPEYIVHEPIKLEVLVTFGVRRLIQAPPQHMPGASFSHRSPDFILTLNHKVNVASTLVPRDIAQAIEPLPHNAHPTNKSSFHQTAIMTKASQQITLFTILASVRFLYLQP